MARKINALTVSAYVYSTMSLIAGSIHIYYDTAAMLITLVLLGKTLERRAKGRVLEGLEPETKHNHKAKRHNFREATKANLIDAPDFVGCKAVFKPQISQITLILKKSSPGPTGELCPNLPQ